MAMIDVVDHYAGRILAVVGQTNVKREDMRAQLCDIIREIQAMGPLSVPVVGRPEGASHVGEASNAVTGICRCAEYHGPGVFTCAACLERRMQPAMGDAEVVGGYSASLPRASSIAGTSSVDTAESHGVIEDEIPRGRAAP